MNDDHSGWVELGGTSLITNSTATTGSILSYTTNTSWDFLNNYDKWPKGVIDYTFEKKYTPKWHILLGYKNQINAMWN